MLAVVSAFVVVAVAGVLYWSTVWRRLAVKRAVVVNLKTGKAISGILYERRGPLLVLKSATLHDGPQTLPVDGDVVVERGAVDFVQIVSGAKG